MDRSRWSMAIRPSLFAILTGLFCLLSAANSFAESSNRWLFIFNTSSAMRDRAPGVQAVAQDLLNSAMHGTMRPGDTIGIWTYGNVLKADEAPLQNWYPDAAADIADHTLQFLSRHPYEKNAAAFGDVMTNLLRVVKISDVITVVLISDGSDAVKGTPFDEHIATFYKGNYQPQRKARMPIVTVFRGEKGVITTNTLALAPWPVDIPAVPPPPPVVKAVVEKPEPVAPPAPAKPVPSLVIIGKKAETTFNVPTDLPDHSGEPPVQPVATPPPAATTPAAPKLETQATPAPEPALAPKVEEKPAPVTTPAAPATIPTAAPVSAPVAAAPAKPVQPTEPQVTTASESKEAPAAKATESPKVEAVATAPDKNPFTVRNIAIVSVVFTLLVCVLLILTARNARRATRASLITRSLDREQK